MSEAVGRRLNLDSPEIGQPRKRFSDKIKKSDYAGAAIEARTLMERGVDIGLIIPWAAYAGRDQERSDALKNKTTHAKDPSEKLGSLEFIGNTKLLQEFSNQTAVADYYEAEKIAKILMEKGTQLEWIIKLAAASQSGIPKPSR